MAKARKRPKSLEGEIDQLLKAGIDCAAISTVLRCRFADVQAGQRRLAIQRDAARREAHAVTQGAMSPAEVDRRAARQLEQTRAEKLSGSVRKGAQHCHLRVGNLASPERVCREDYAVLPRHWGFFASDD